MMTFARALRVIDDFLQAEPIDAPLNFNAPVHFDPQLTTRLLATHEALNARYAAILYMLELDTALAVSPLNECAAMLQDLRRTESVWLYPFIAAGVDDDIAARRQLMQLRISLLTELRATFRQIDDMLKAIHTGLRVKAVAELVSASMADYLRRSETEIYPLYDLIGTRQTATRVA